MKSFTYILILVVFIICAHEILAAPLTASQIVSRARREVLVKFHVLPSHLDAVSLLPSELQATCLEAGRALPVRASDFDSRELGKILRQLRPLKQQLEQQQQAFQTDRSRLSKDEAILEKMRAEMIGFEDRLSSVQSDLE